MAEMRLKGQSGADEASRPAPAEGHCVALVRHDIHKVFVYMDSHLNRRIRLSELARLWGVRAEHFCHAFKAATGRTPGAYVRTLRLEQAKSLLESTDLAVKEIMGHVGFNDFSHFSRDFKQRFGVSPREHRARIQNQKQASGARDKGKTQFPSTNRKIGQANIIDM